MKSSKNSANIITEEAKLDKDRDKLGNAAFIIKKKLNEAASDEGRANSIETIINKETAQINDNIKQTGSKHNHSDVSNKQDTQDNDKTNRKDEMEKSIDTYV
ncbi:hypothetical protein CcarbDRAFT_2381 [Clostridium carboxidivorans P7]|uniref:Uncharacterized protein n=2 Tax=Clostridium TaxID=1485 RepID=C6PUB4_9CLOT|nr:hypothetical protein [Clostridium carboxidivorans]EET87212.1 hypothetical protein CcarbDRAFT_2381 [Clostridium carboxidivorans P7]